MNLPDLHLLRPGWLLALIPLALGLWRLARNNTGAAAWRGVVDTHLLPHLLVGQDGRTRWLPLLLLALGGLLGTLALAGPVWQRLPQPAFQAQAQRVIVLDISPGMNASDLPPSRLAHARYEILDLLKRFQEGQTALIAYGAEPFVVSPLTADAKTIAAQVPSLSTDLLPVQGDKRTDLALQAAGRLLGQAGSPHGQVILLTDALDHPAAALQAARQLRDKGYRLSVLGVGTAEGAPVPAADGGFVKSGDGSPLVAKLDTEALRSLAKSGGGHYVTSRSDDRDLQALDTDTGRERRATAAGEPTVLADQWREEGPWLLLALLPLAAVGFRRGWLAPLVLVVLLVPAPPASAFSWSNLWQRPDQQAAGLLQQGQAQAAAGVFERPDWRAAAAYQAGDYAAALKNLEDMQNPTASYNRGNTLARLGDYQQAIDAYDQALAGNPDNADARHNRELVQRLLQQQQQQQQQQGQQGQKDQQDNEGKSGQQQGGSQQDGEQSAGQNQKQQKGDQQQSGDQANSQPSSSGQSQSPANADQNGSQQGKHENAPAAASQEAQAQPQTAADANGASNQADEKTVQPSPQQNAQTQSADAGTNNNNKPSGMKQSPETDNGKTSSAAEHQSASNATSDKRTDTAGAQPGLADLLNTRGNQSAGKPPAPPAPPMTEAQQAMEHQLNRVPDDPAGLLRQRFLLQHLRRTGQL